MDFYKDSVNSLSKSTLQPTIWIILACDFWIEMAGYGVIWATWTVDIQQNPIAAVF